MLEYIHELQWASEMSSGKFTPSEIKLFQLDVDKNWTSFEIILFHM